MRFSWHISANDIRQVQNLVRSQRSANMVKTRKARYRRRGSQPVTRATFWRASILGLVTSQQPSGPKTHVRRFLKRPPFLLSYRRCKEARSLRGYSEKVIREAGLRFSNRLADMVVSNFPRVDGDLWGDTSEVLEHLRKARWRGQTRTKRAERDAAEFIDRHYKGFGPKQSRNMLQFLGLTKYEIPLDSRVMKWLNDFGFPIRLSATGLADRHYYTFVLDAVQALCEKSDVEPFILDAAIFTSFDEAAGGA